MSPYTIDRSSNVSAESSLPNGFSVLTSLAEVGDASASALGDQGKAMGDLTAMIPEDSHRSWRL